MKNFKIKIWFGSNQTELLLKAPSGAYAMLLARRMYPSSRVSSAVEVK